MNVRNAALLGLLALSLGLLSWFVLRGDGTDERTVSRRSEGSGQPSSPHEASPAELPLAEPERESGRSEAQITASAAGADDVRPAPRTWPEEETRWIDVRVISPAGTPADERPRVLALAEGGDHGDVYGGEGPVAELNSGTEPGRIDDVFAAATVEANGLARLGLPPDADVTWLVVSGSYLYSLEPERVDVGEASGTVELRPVLGAHVTGRLIAPSADPEVARSQVAQVAIELDWSINAALELGTAGALDLDLETESDDEGRFEFRAVPVGKPQTISTNDSPLARAFHEDIQPAPGDRVEVVLDLLIGGTVRGRIVDESGEPITEAEVGAAGREILGSPTERLCTTESDATGAFLLEGITPGKVWLRVEKDDYQVHLSSSFVLADREVREHGDIELNEGLAVSGTIVFPDGRAAVGASVSVQPDLSENLGGSPVNPRAYIGAGNGDTADEAGSFRIKAVGTGPWVVTAQLEVKDGEVEVAPGQWNANQGVVRAPDATLRLTLEPPMAVSGVVLDAEQRPVTTFTLLGERAGSQWYMPPSASRENTFESEDGRFTMDGLRSGSWTFSTEAPGFARSEEITLELPSDEEITLVLYRPVRLAGSVVDPQGRSVAGAQISKELEGTEVFEAMQGRGDWPETLSDDQGSFSLEGLAPGAGSVVAKKDGFAPSAALPYELAEGQEMVDLVLTMRRGGTITGEVYEKDGDHASGCLVILQMPTLAERRFTNTGSDGEFTESGLTPGTWQVQAFPGIESLQSESGESLDQAALLAALKMTVVELADEAEEHVVLGEPPADPVRVHGQVTLDGEPQRDSIISFVPGSGGGIASLKIASLDKDGRYDLQLDEPGDYLVTIQATSTTGRQNSIEYRRSIPKDESHELDFGLPLARVSGRVLGPGGDPLSGARVTLTVDGGLVFGTVFGGQYSELATDENGEYSIVGLRPGSYTVAAGGAPFGGLLGQSSGLGRVVRSIEVEEGESIGGLDFRLEEPGRVQGMVRDALGQPVAGASIFLRDGNGHLVELFSLAQTNASGTFEYPGLAPGEYTVTARSETLASATSEQVRVRSGESSQITIVVGPGTMLIVTLVDKTGANIRARVSVLDEDGHDLNGMLGLTEIMERYSGGLDSTAQRIGPLPPGSYKVRAVAEDGRSTQRPVRLKGQEERKLKLRLK